MNDLTNRQRSLLKFLAENPEAYQRPPLRALVKKTSYKTKAGVDGGFKSLIRRGYLDEHGHPTGKGYVEVN